MPLQAGIRRIRVLLERTIVEDGDPEIVSRIPLADVVCANSVIYSQALGRFPGILTIQRVLVVFEIVNRNDIGLAIPGRASQQEIGVYVSGTCASVRLEIIRPV